MKTIKERAEDFTKGLSADIGATMQREMETMCKSLVEMGFVAGVQSEHAELTRWNSPECPPEDDRDILLKIKSDTRFFPDTHYFAVGFYSGMKYHITLVRHVEIEVVGWREIHE